MGVCQKGLGRRKDDERAHCKESCDSAEGDWPWHCLGSSAPPQVQEKRQAAPPSHNILETVSSSHYVFFFKCACVFLRERECVSFLWWHQGFSNTKTQCSVFCFPSSALWYHLLYLTSLLCWHHLIKNNKWQHPEFLLHLLNLTASPFGFPGRHAN